MFILFLLEEKLKIFFVPFPILNDRYQPQNDTEALYGESRHVGPTQTSWSSCDFQDYRQMDVGTRQQEGTEA